MRHWIFASSLFLFAMACSAESSLSSSVKDNTACRYSVEKRTINYDYSYNYYWSPCNDVAQQGHAAYFRQRINLKPQSDREALYFPSQITDDMRIEAIGPRYIYFRTKSKNIKYMSYDGKEYGTINIVENGTNESYGVEDYVDRWVLGSGDDGFYYLIDVGGRKKYLHVSSDNKTTLIDESDIQGVFFSDDYYAPALKVVVDPEKKQIRRIDRLLGGATLFGESYFQKHGVISYTSMPVGVPLISRDAKILVLVGNMNLADHRDIKQYITAYNKVLVLRYNEDISEIKFDNYISFPMDIVKISPNGNYLSIIDNNFVNFFSTSKISKSSKIKIPVFDYSKYQKKGFYSSYAYYFSDNDAVTLYDGDGHYFKMKTMLQGDR